MSKNRCIVFLGPSLPRSKAKAIFDASYRPPAGQGDIMRACAEGPSAIGLIDGIFKDAPTVRHREILWAMAHGIPVFGAASMGALRAAELSRQGMIGVGLIYRWYRRFALLPDDAVAVTHGPAALGAPALSDALVDIRRALSAATRQGLLSCDDAKAHLRHIKALPFAERHLPQVAGAAMPSQKAHDGAQLLHRMANHSVNDDWPATTCGMPPIVDAWLDDLSDGGIELGGSGFGKHDV
ncbi:TfuA-like protein [Sulfitobacter sp. F26204]|uniref:TfuA-like protein n=1 Tax=Sulfitobacter sp. F26204 TaxID=2996014 RepID=UPI00225E283E|nr:TfuA-like protein [Sulfitobacter sp. F26204]MCX7559239.1 TfuA-like protein [Sulfitobacter sp. F26204]